MSLWWKMNAGNDEESTLQDNQKNVEKCSITVSNKGLLCDCYISFYGHADYI